MSAGLNVHKKHVIEYDYSGWFSNDLRNFINILRNLNIPFTSNDEETEFEIEREDLSKGIETLKMVDRGEETDVYVDDLTMCLNDENITLKELIACFKWLISKSDKKNTSIYISYF